MKLSELLNGLVDLTEKGSKVFGSLEISGLALDSRAVKTGDAFFALAGANQHGFLHIEEVIAKGAKVVLFDPDDDGVRYAENIKQIPVIPVKQLGLMLGEFGARFYKQPTENLAVIGITGTNGKTSCSQFLGQALDECGIIGTLGWGHSGALNKTINTTPDALTLQKIFAEFVKEHKKNIAMEVSSHGLAQGRVRGIKFKGAVYTNVSRDHLDYHGSMEAYLAAKLQLLQMPGLSFVVINLDDASSEQIINATPKAVKIWGVSTKVKRFDLGEAVIAEGIKLTSTGIKFNVSWSGKIQQIEAPLFGDFNVENLLCVVGVMLALGYVLPEIAIKLKNVQPVRGRMERCGTITDDVSVFVDYAHTPDALDRVLASVRKHCQQSLWVVFGCGGNRDAGKRPQMGSIAEQWADVVIVTDDNPRFEDNKQIAKEIVSGCRADKVIVILDRKEAIQHAITNASKNDYIVIAGKGHETYQEINGVQHPFNDKEIIETALIKRPRTQ